MKKEQTKSFLAIEFASSAVKLVQMKELEKGFQLLKAQSVSISANEPLKNQDDFWREAARKLLSQEKLTEQNLILSINNPHTCFSQFVLPKIPKKELAQTLKWKMKDEMPFPPEEAVLDYRLFEMSAGEKAPRFSTLVAALPRDVIDRCLKLLPAAGTASFIPTFVPFSILSLPKALPLSNQELIVVVDIGHSITEIAFYRNGKLSFLRKITFGGQTLSQLMMQPLVTEGGHQALGMEEAERAKKEENLFDITSQNLIAGKIEIPKLYALIRPELEKLSSELERSLDYYAQEHGTNAAQIFLTGGTSRLKGLAQFLEQKFEIPVKRIELKRDLEIAGGIQQEDLDPYYRLISLVLDRKDIHASPFTELTKSVERISHSISYVKTAIFVFIFFLILAGGMSLRYQQILRKTDDLRAQIANLKYGFGESKKIQELEAQIKQGDILSSIILSQEPYWEEVFRELSHVFPNDVILTDVSYEQNSLVLTGNILTKASVSKLLQAMEGPIFHKVALINTEQKGDFVTFSIRCEVS